MFHGLYFMHRYVCTSPQPNIFSLKLDLYTGTCGMLSLLLSWFSSNSFPFLPNYLTLSFSPTVLFCTLISRSRSPSIRTRKLIFPSKHFKTWFSIAAAWTLYTSRFMFTFFLTFLLRVYFPHLHTNMQLYYSQGSERKKKKRWIFKGTSVQKNTGSIHAKINF